MLSTITRKTDRRRKGRDPINVSLSILCTDQNGRETVMHAQLLDISAFGARLGILQKIPTHSAVTFYEHKLGVGGRGTVRFCRTARKGYEVGLEFPNGTGWSPAVREKADLLKPTATVCRDQPVSPDLPVDPIVPSRG